jgi:uncharacterized protein
MVWLVAGLPAAAVIASFTTLFIAANDPNPMVNAGYQKEGMAPIKDTSKEEFAVANSITGQLVLTNTEARIVLSGRLPSIPASLELLLLHPSHDDQDMKIQLHSRGQGVYSAFLPDGKAGKRQWILEPDDRSWRLSGELTLPLTGGLRLANDSLITTPP